MFKILNQIFLSKRAKALYWSGFMMLLAGLLDIATNVFDSIDQSNMYTIGLGLVLAQFSKALNNHLSKNG